MENGTYQKTINGYTPVVADKGYWVAIEEITLDDVAIGELVGVWTDEQGKMWIDRVIRLSDLTTALTVGKAFSQKAIYDILNLVEIKVDNDTN